jgi:regulation of enolase protein 1 (concanavalin A-like superfamily)
MRIAALAMLTLCALPQEKVLFEEKFQKKLSDGWTWVREDAKGWKIADGGLEIRAQAGTIWEKTNSAKNLLLRKPPVKGGDEDPFAIEATVKSAPAATAEQAGVILYQDDDTYVKLVREHLEGKVWVVMAREAGGQTTVWAKKEVEGEVHGLRLISHGMKIQGEVKQGNPPMWMPAYYGETPFKGEFKAGLVAHGAPADAQRWARFTDVRIVQSDARR